MQACGVKSAWNGTACSCVSGFYLIQNSCLPCDKNSNYYPAFSTCICNPGFYGNFQLCNACDASCLTCFSSGPNSCISCPSDKVLLNGACLGCGAGKFISNGQCASCSSNCNTCSSPNICLTCLPNYILTTNAAGGVTTVTCVLPTSPPAPPTTPNANMALKGVVVGNKIIYQGFTLSLLPAYFLSTGCVNCGDLFIVTIKPNNLGITYVIDYVVNSQYWFVVEFAYGSAGMTPTFDFQIQINPKYANYFTSVDMASSLNGSITSAQYPSSPNPGPKVKTPAKFASSAPVGTV